LGLFTTVYISYTSSGTGAHASVYTSAGFNGGPSLYDPAGDYALAQGGGTLSIVNGADADTVGYLLYQLFQDNYVTAFTFDTTPSQEEDIINKAYAQAYAFPGECALRTSSAIEGIGPFNSISPTFFPMNLANQLAGLPGAQITTFTPALP